MSTNCFALQTFVPNKVTEKTRTDEYIVSREFKEKFINQDGDVVREYVTIETSATKRDDYINSFRDEVGLENILNQVRMTGDDTLLNRTKRIAGEIDYVDENGKVFEKVSDYTSIPSDPQEAAAIVEQGYQLFKTIPAELKGNKSFAEFVESCSDEDLKTYLQAQIKKEGNDNV